MKFCSTCGASVSFETPPDDHLPRFICHTCNTIHYQNPRIIAGCVPVWEDRILICRRAIEPRRGYWTLPAGFMENGESVENGAAREAQEEALADVEIGSLLAVINVIHAHQVHMMFRARLRSLDFGVGHESLREDEIPWGELAFQSIRFSLERFLADRAAGNEPLHMHTLP
jgi:ADP-ribose pyrophosphatase YjhB (NUDIX family)